MATGFAYTTRSWCRSHTRHHLKNPSPCFFTASSPLSVTSLPHLHRPSIILRARLVRCLAAAPGPPSPPEFDPNHFRLKGVVRVVSGVQDRVRIFFAVLFWMSLFFWASVSDRRGNGRKKKGSRFK